MIDARVQGSSRPSYEYMLLRSALVCHLKIKHSFDRFANEDNLELLELVDDQMDRLVDHIIDDEFRYIFNTIKREAITRGNIMAREKVSNDAFTSASDIDYCFSWFT